MDEKYGQQEPYVGRFRRQQGGKVLAIKESAGDMQQRTYIPKGSEANRLVADDVHGIQCRGQGLQTLPNTVDKIVQVLLDKIMERKGFGSRQSNWIRGSVDNFCFVIMVMKNHMIGQELQGI